MVLGAKNKMVAMIMMVVMMMVMVVMTMMVVMMMVITSRLTIQTEATITLAEKRDRCGSCGRTMIMYLNEVIACLLVLFGGENRN